jgi:hypothetical protein
MYRIVAITACIAAALLAPLTLRAAQEAQMPNTASSEEADAIARAKELLTTQLRVAVNEIEVISAESKTWNDSSLGCGKPGTMALQVLTPGYAVTLRAQGKVHRVHVAGNQAIVCERPVLLRKPRGAARARGVDTMMQLAREDLAKQLGVDSTDIRIAGMKPHQWNDSTMECPLTDEALRPGPIQGYKLSLRYQQRIYTYHTDMVNVRACPPISKD